MFNYRRYPKRFWPAFRYLLGLEKDANVLGIFIYGSVVRGDTHEDSDLDAKIIMSDNAPGFSSEKRPGITQIKKGKIILEYTAIASYFFKVESQERMKAGKKPFLLESEILFDKSHRLAQWRREALAAKVPFPDKKEIAAMTTHLGNEMKKIGRYLKDEAHFHLLGKDFESQRAIAALAAHQIMNGESNKLLLYWFRLNRIWFEDYKKFATVVREKDPVFFDCFFRLASERGLGARFVAWGELTQIILEKIKKNEAAS